ncbi:hypothetical protein OAY_10150 [Vibrio cyclitrophicus ZF205]|nr:hypothetical protein OAY_10150 [Vibrio cyclitrophicus ZF205]
MTVLFVHLGGWLLLSLLSLLFTPMFHMKIFFGARFLQQLFARYFIFNLLINMSITWSFEQARNDQIGFFSF